MLVGRDVEREVLENVLGDAVRGRARVLLLVGENGVGKSALLTEFGAAADARGARVVTVEAIEPEREIPGAAVSILVATLSDVVDEVPPAAATSLRATARGVVDGHLPGALLALLARAAEAAPLVVIADDAQWWDPESLGALMFAARRLSADDVAVLVAGRTSAADLPTLQGVRRLVVPPLSAEAAAVMLRAATPDLVPEVAAALVDTLGGNPFVLLDSVSLLPARVRIGAEPLPDPVPVGSALSGRWSQVLLTLPPRTRSALAVLAAEGSGDATVVQAAWALQDCCADDLPAAEARQVVVLGPHGWAFPNAVVRASVFAALTPPERRAAHAALAEVLRDRGRDARYAHHLAQSLVGVDDVAAEELMRVADTLAAAGSTTASAAAAQHAARLSHAGPEHAARLLRAAQLSLLARDEENAAALAEQGLTLGTDPRTAAGFRRVLGVVVGDLRDTRRGVALLREAAADLDGEERLGALVDALAFVRMWSDPGASAAAIAEIGDLDALEPWMRLVVGNALAAAGLWTAAVPLLEAGLRDVDPTAADIGETACDAWMDAASIMGLHAYRERFRDAASRQLDSGTIPHSAMGLVMQVELAYADGRWSDAARINDVLRELDVAYGRFPQYEVGNDMRIAARRGDRETFERMEVQMMRVAAGSGQTLLLASSQGLRATLHVSLGEHEEAEPLLRECVAAATPGPLVTTIFPSATVTLVGHLARTGRLDEARDVVQDVAPRLVVQPSPLAQAYAERLLALTAPDAEADERFRLASSWNDKGMHAFEGARTRLEHGQWLRRRRRRSDAVDQLVAALGDFERMGCTPWATLCRDELHAAGVDTTRADRYDATAVLTAQERQVAEAVAEGLTNAAVAHRLFLSPKTVELHLTHVYRKLGISGRGELAGALDAARS